MATPIIFISGFTAWTNFVRRFSRNQAGNTLALMAAAIIPIAGMIGSGLDMARIYMAEARMQTACDAAALAARRAMDGNIFTEDVQAEGERFFDFNFPASTMDAANLTLDVNHSTADASTIEVRASADIPTTIMSLFGRDSVPITVSCDADQDQGHTDIMLVLDVTGSMNDAPSVGGEPKITRLRAAATSLYRALDMGGDSRTRYGIMPYSMTVNVGRSLRDSDILRTTHYHKRLRRNRWEFRGVHIDDTGWEGGTDSQDIAVWRSSDAACIEERSDIGTNSLPVSVDTTVTQDDIDSIASNTSDTDRQWGRYDPGEQMGEGYSFCPSPGSRLQTFSSASRFDTAIDDATDRIAGYTYHDIGLVWGARFLSQSGMFSVDNMPTHNGVPVAMHIVFLTDGILNTDSRAYSAYGVNRRASRIDGWGSLEERHQARFQSACNTAKTMGMTIWVIALDVTEIDDIRPCATSDGHFFVSDGSDLEEVFSQIGQGIGRLRLTR